MVFSDVIPEASASPTKTIRSPSTPTSARIAGLPEPSNTVPPEIRMSTREVAVPPPFVVGEQLIRIAIKLTAATDTYWYLTCIRKAYPILMKVVTK
jgi:hypothetical protein